MTGYQEAMLAGLEGLGVDISGAEGLEGEELDQWIDEAEQASFDEVMRDTFGDEA